MNAKLVAEPIGKKACLAFAKRNKKLVSAFTLTRMILVMNRADTESRVSLETASFAKRSISLSVVSFLIF